jgi:AcrR family transcriptional regulator
MTSQPTVRRTQEERVAESARRLLEAAIDLISEQGWERTTTAEISRRAGYSRAMANARYGSKEALLDTIMRTEYEERLQYIPDGSATGLDQVLGVIDRLGGIASGESQFMRAVFILSFEAIGPAVSLRPRIDSWVRRLGEGLTAGVEQGQQDGTIRGELEPEDVAGDLLSHGIGLVYRWVLTPDLVDVRAEIDRWRTRVRAELSPARPR